MISKFVVIAEVFSHIDHKILRDVLWVRTVGVDSTSIVEKQTSIRAWRSSCGIGVVVYIGGVAFRTIAERTLQFQLRVSPERLAGAVEWRSLCFFWKC